MSMGARTRGHPGYWAFLVHRVSGIALVLFLPFHFWALGSALTGTARLDELLHWTAHPLAKAAEWGLVVLLAAHFAGGLRLLALEFLAWRDWHRQLLAAAGVVTAAFGVAFLFNVV